MATEHVFIFATLEQGFDIANAMNLRQYKIICHPDHLSPHKDGTLLVPWEHQYELIWGAIEHVAKANNFRIILLHT